ENVAQKNVTPPIRVRLEAPPSPVAPPEVNPAPNLRLKEKPRQSPPDTQPPPPSQPPPSDDPVQRLAIAARQQLAALDQAGEFYPLEAIAQRQEGDVVVRIFFDEAGNVIAARLEEGSGHPLLDAAALKAARSLQSLPADGLESLILPVRFRLRKMP
ncbi:MAG: energy transducer TonB, partial [Zoogloeaceae bacterium]|nr:energy transducer TonB [Zoogloeaceae bacterium]